jgi:hypothetical protein
MWHSAVWQKYANVSGERAASETSRQAANKIYLLPAGYFFP